MVENLTDAECKYINDRAKCPDCKLGQLLLGPRGGMSLNVRCNFPSCNHEFNISFGNGLVIHGERLDRNLPEAYSGAWLAVIRKPEK